MSKYKIIFLVSVCITVLPYLGLPVSLKNLIISLLGVVLMSISFMIQNKNKKGEEVRKEFENFSESNLEELKENI